jgi:hypothetical protein
MTVHTYRKIFLPRTALDLNCHNWPHASLYDLKRTQIEHNDEEWQTKLLPTALHVYLAKADYVADSIVNYKRQSQKFHRLFR